MNDSSPPDTRRSLLTALWIMWTVLILCSYYSRLRLLIQGDSSFTAALVDDGLLLPSFFVFLGMGLVILLHNTKERWQTSHLTRSLFRLHPQAMFLILVCVVALAGLASARWWLPWLPHLRESAIRSLRAVFGAGLVLAGAFTLGRMVLKPFRRMFEDRLEDFVLTMAIGFGCISIGSFALGLMRWYTPTVIQWCLGVLVGAALILILPGIIREWKSSVSERSTSVAADVESRGTAFWKTLAVLASVIALIGALAPEVEYDALWYHLWLPKLWLQAGGPVDPVQEYISLYPLNCELVFGAAMSGGGAVAAKLVHYTDFLLMALAVFICTRKFSRGVSPWLASALVMTAPTVLWEATTAYVDIGLALHTTLSAYALLRWTESRRQGWLVLAAVVMGIALGTKHLALLFLCGEAAGIMLWTWVQTKQFHKVLGSASVFVLLALVIASPWYLRAYAASGNPVFPDLYGIFGAEPAQRWGPSAELQLEHFKARFGFGRSPLNLVLLPWYITTQGSRFGSTFGPLFLVFLPIVLLRHRWTRLTGALVLLITIYVLLWASPFSSFQGRFLIPIIPLLAILGAGGFAAAFERCSESRFPGSRRWLVAFVSILMFLNLPPFISLHEGNRQGWTGWLIHVVRRVPAGVVVGTTGRDEYLTANVHSYGAWQFVNRSLPASARVLTFSGGDQLYSNRERLWAESAMAFPAVWGAMGKDSRYVTSTLEGLGVSHLLLDKSRLDLDRSKGLPIVQKEFLEEYCEEVYGDYWFSLYRIRKEGEDPLHPFSPASLAICNR
jgi:hypothetical protein